MPVMGTEEVMSKKSPLQCGLLTTGPIAGSQKFYRRGDLECAQFCSMCGLHFCLMRILRSLNGVGAGEEEMAR